MNNIVNQDSVWISNTGKKYLNRRSSVKGNAKPRNTSGQILMEAVSIKITTVIKIEKTNTTLKAASKIF